MKLAFANLHLPLRIPLSVRNSSMTHTRRIVRVRGVLAGARVRGATKGESWGGDKNTA